MGFASAGAADEDRVTLGVEEAAGGEYTHPHFIDRSVRNLFFFFKQKTAYEIISFDDQVGAHGSAGGDQVYPFIISPERLGLASEILEDARDIHRTVLARYAAANAENAPPSAARLTPAVPRAAV